MQKPSLPCAILILAGFLAAVSHADGPPIGADGRVKVNHVVLVLSESQVAQVGRARELTLSADQRDLMKKLERRFPSTIRVITPHYADCACGMSAYGIWTRENQVAIPCNTLTPPDKESKPAERADPHSGKIHSFSQIVVDLQGTLYVASQPVAEAEVEKALSEIARAEPDNRILFLNLPPNCGEKNDKPIRELVERLKKMVKTAGVKIIIGG